MIEIRDMKMSDNTKERTKEGQHPVMLCTKPQVEEATEGLGEDVSA